MLLSDHWWLWVSFSVFILVILGVDLFFCERRQSGPISAKKAFILSMMWVLLTFIFSVGLWYFLKEKSGQLVADEKTLEFVTCYLIEKSLSLDNLFIFIIIFKSFAIPVTYQRRILLHGVIASIVLRLSVILLGISLVSHFHWILYGFGAFLVISGIKMFFLEKAFSVHMDKSAILTWLKKHLRVTDKLYQEKFFIRKKNKIYATPLFLALLFIEISDLIFAIDSIPAAFAITEEPFILFSANIFAVMGLRTLYFLLLTIMERFYFLKQALMIILMFTGLKILIAPWISISTLITLGTVISILVVCVFLSWIKARQSSNI
jgi:TerC family integral membrane protein